jgi:NADH-quinone oxidoreductase subunit L
MIHAAFLIPALPLLGFFVLATFGKRLGNPAAGWLATGLVAASFVVTILVFIALFTHSPGTRIVSEPWFTWFAAGKLNVGIGLLVDPLSMTMAAFVTGVSSLIHLYSIGYMEHDEGYPKFFLYLNLFVFSMLMLVLGSSFIVTFFGWEGVGVCSYFLISFWFGRPAATTAGKKAMIYNRIGDAGFMLAMFLIFERTGSLQYTTVFARLGSISSTDLIAIALLLFLGAAGKSAQLPLFPWLADAMEGPTPVSALIHAATMVTAGVYLMCRINPILHLAPDAAHTIAWIGVATALIGAMSGCAQTDIKKVLAYSTVSQLGYMFLAVGSGAYVAAIFLMLTHAFYKALLFLGAGSVIHGMDDEQNIKRMGALAKFMPLTAITFLIGWFSIAGVPPFSGFWSKGDVLENAYSVSPALWVVAAFTAVVTAYYMGRLYLLVFTGDKRWQEGDVAASGARGAAAHESTDTHHPHEPRKVMTLPLVVLSVAAVVGGLLNLPFHPNLVFLERWLSPVVGANLADPHDSASKLWVLSIADGVFAIAGLSLAYVLWRGTVDRPKLEPRFFYMAWFIDATFDRLIARPSSALAAFSATVIDAKVIDGAVNGIAHLAKTSGDKLRKIQTGYVRNYALGIVGGTVVIVAYFLIRAKG